MTLLSAMDRVMYDSQRQVMDNSSLGLPHMYCFFSYPPTNPLLSESFSALIFTSVPSLIQSIYAASSDSDIKVNTSNGIFKHLLAWYPKSLALNPLLYLVAVWTSRDLTDPDFVHDLFLWPIKTDSTSLRNTRINTLCLGMPAHPPNSGTIVFKFWRKCPRRPLKRQLAELSSPWPTVVDNSSVIHSNL